MLQMNELGVLVSLFPDKAFRTIKEVQKRCSYSYERIHSAIGVLGKKEALHTKRYGNVIVVAPNYNSDLTFLAFVHYMIGLKTRMYSEQAAKLPPIIPGAQKGVSTSLRGCGDEMVSCLREIENMNAEIIAIAEISRTPKNKISFFYTKDRNIVDQILKLEYRYGIKIDSRMETEDTLRAKKEDPFYLNTIVLKGLEKYYNIFYS
ncbi:MAG: hypothetical protein ACP5E4_00080 [Candidatus Aenigmatarchaeota archaeon]